MPKTKFKRSFWIIVSFFIMIIFFMGSFIVLSLARYSTRHELACKQCHPQIFQLWKDSKGHPSKETSCFACHSSSHITVPPEYLADDDLTSEQCLYCHEDVLDYGYTFKKTIIKFNHRQHVHEGQNCVACHRSTGHEYMTDGTNRPTIVECQDCHFREFEGLPKNQKCLNCHDVLLVPGKK